MSTPAASSAEKSELDSLFEAISEGIEALVNWDAVAFQSAVERQREICDGLRVRSPSPIDAAMALRVRELNRVYDRLLQHSIHWTRTLRAILQSTGGAFPQRPSLDFRG